MAETVYNALFLFSFFLNQSSCYDINAVNTWLGTRRMTMLGGHKKRAMSSFKSCIDSNSNNNNNTVNSSSNNTISIQKLRKKTRSMLSVLLPHVRNFNPYTSSFLNGPTFTWVSTVAALLLLMLLLPLSSWQWSVCLCLQYYYYYYEQTSKNMNYHLENLQSCWYWHMYSNACPEWKFFVIFMCCFCAVRPPWKRNRSAWMW